MKKSIKLISLLLVLVLAFSLTACGKTESPKAETEEPLKIKLILFPKFEVGEFSGDYPGEAQYFYENYFTDAQTFDIKGGNGDQKLYYNDGLAMYVIGEGKINCATTLTSMLLDERFDFSDAYFLTVGCGGGAYERSVIGDIFLITGVADGDLGHRADIRELTTDRGYGWFREDDYDDFGYLIMNENLVNEVYPLIKDIKPQLPAAAKEYMAEHFDNAEWAVRDPAVLKGSSVTGDCYWKGVYLSREATAVAESYGLPDPYMITEMEDISLGIVLKKFNLADRYLGVRVNVNMDVFVGNMTPENTWGDAVSETRLAVDETAGCFEYGMKNLYEVSSIVIDYLMNK